MATNALGSGSLVDITASGAYSSGDPVQEGSYLFGIAIADIASGAVGTIQTDGEWRLTKDTHASTKAFSVGDPVFWDDANGECEVIAEAHTAGFIFIGTAIADAASTATTVDVILVGHGGYRPGGDFVRGAAIPVAIAPNQTLIENWVAPQDCTITAIGVACTTQPTTAGTYTLAVADVTGAGSTNLLTGATMDLDATITAGTELAATLTATAADLNLSSGDHVAFTVASNNLDLTGAGLVIVLRYRSR